QSMRAYTQGSFADRTAERARGIAWNTSFCIGWLLILGLFLLGLYAGRRRVFQNLSVHLPFIRKAIGVAFVLGVAGTLVRAGVLKLPEARSAFINGFLEELVDTAGFLGVAFFYAAAIILLGQTSAGKALLSPLASVGRMALSNYLFQSLVCTTLFYSY